MKELINCSILPGSNFSTMSAIVLIIVYQITSALANIYVETNAVTLRFSVTSDECSVGNERIRFFHPISLPHCVVECELRPNCVAVNYFQRMEACEIFSSTSVEVTKLNQGTCDHVKRDDIHVIQRCCANCKPGMVRDRNSKKCEYKECADFPTVENGRVLGNQKGIGMTIRYLCNAGFIEKQNIYSAKCLPTGQWNQIANCTLNCMDGWIPFRGSCFLFEYKSKQYWTDAKKDCESKNSTLVKVADNITHQFIRDEIKKTGVLDSWWIGGKCDNNQEGYLWLDGTTVDFNGWGNDMSDECENGYMIYMKNENMDWKFGKVDASRKPILLHFICKLDVIQSA